MESFSKLIINFFFGLSELAVYDFLLKITEALRKPFSLLSQAFFANLSKNKDMKMSKKILHMHTLLNSESKKFASLNFSEALLFI